MNHTKGPWNITGCYNHFIDSKKDSEDHTTIICEIWNHNKDANARLISAAPEMLDALIVAYNALEYVSDYDIPLCTHETIKKAIERATNMKIEEVLKYENNL